MRWDECSLLGCLGAQIKVVEQGSLNGKPTVFPDFERAANCLFPAGTELRIGWMRRLTHDLRYGPDHCAGVHRTLTANHSGCRREDVSNTYLFAFWLFGLGLSMLLSMTRRRYRISLQPIMPASSASRRPAPSPEVKRHQ